MYFCMYLNRLFRTIRHRHVSFFPMFSYLCSLKVLNKDNFWFVNISLGMIYSALTKSLLVFYKKGDFCWYTKLFQHFFCLRYKYIIFLTIRNSIINWTKLLYLVPNLSLYTQPLQMFLRYTYKCTSNQL